MTKKQTHIPYGFITGLAMIVVGVIFQVMKMSTTPWAQWLPMVVLLTGVILNAQAFSKAHDGANDQLRPFRRGQIMYERLINLEFIEGKTLQVAQRRVSRSEIVNRNPQAKRAEPVQGRYRFCAIRKKHRLGDLKFQTSGW